MIQWGGWLITVMETTRHFTTKVYIVNNGATALHKHPNFGIYLPPGGHVERDELPHKSGIREAKEETGLEPELYRETNEIDVPGGHPLPQPAYHLLYDVNTYLDGSVGHQHIDFIYFARVSSRNINPEDDEVASDAWDWYSVEDLESGDFDSDTVQIGIEAIKTVEEWTSSAE